MKLTPRQGEVLILLANGKSRAETAAQLGVTERAVQWHRRVLFRKLEVTDRAAAVSRAVELGLIGPERTEAFA